jgi:environmental stress-induced protein Ves
MAASFNIIRRSAHRIMPWKNGGGTTAEIAIHPPGATVATGFDWRLSMAAVMSDGPFSAFPLHDRTLLLLAGRGMTVTFDGDGASGGHGNGDSHSEVFALLAEPFVPLRFGGERPASCRLIEGPCEDLNLMVAKQAHVYSASVLDECDRLLDGPSGSTRLFVLLRGAASCCCPATGNVLASLQPRDTVVVEPTSAEAGTPPQPPKVQATPGSLFFAATITNNNGQHPL